MRKLLLLLILSATLLGCAAPHSNEVTVHVSVPANNTVYFPNGFGLVYHYNGKKYLALFNQSSPFKCGYTPADLTFIGGVLIKVKVGNKTYMPYKVLVEQKRFSWRIVYYEGKLTNLTQK